MSAADVAGVLGGMQFVVLAQVLFEALVTARLRICAGLTAGRCAGCWQVLVTQWAHVCEIEGRALGGMQFVSGVYAAVFFL